MPGNTRSALVLRRVACLCPYLFVGTARARCNTLIPLNISRTRPISRGFASLTPVPRHELRGANGMVLDGDAGGGRKRARTAVGPSKHERCIGPYDPLSMCVRCAKDVRKACEPGRGSPRQRVPRNAGQGHEPRTRFCSRAGSQAAHRRPARRSLPADRTRASLCNSLPPRPARAQR